MEIEVGEYVRTKTGNITKVIKVKDTVIWTEEFIDVFCRYNEGIIDKNDIAKHSKDIIDLIQEGDRLKIIADGQPLTFELDELDYKHKLKNIGNEIQIKSIITREQMESIEYLLEKEWKNENQRSIFARNAIFIGRQYS